MRSTQLGFSLIALILTGCLSLRETGGNNNGGSGGQAGSGGSAGGAGGSGGTSSSGGSAGSGGGSGGTSSGGSGGGSSDTSKKDAAPDGRLGPDTGSGGAANGGHGGGTVQSGGAGGGSGPSGGATGTGGKPGTGGTPGTGGSGTGGNTAPTPCSFPSNWNPGDPTYTTYTLPNPSTACGYEGTNNTIKNIYNGSHFAAIPGNTSQDFQTRDRCGACVKIGNAIITIVDECPNDSNPPCKANPGGHLDLSNSGASAGGVRGDPAVRGQNKWSFVPCPITGNVIVRLKPGNNNEIFIENMILPISAVTCGGQVGSRTYYGAWHFSANIPGADCEVTDIANRKILVKAGTTQGQNVDTGVQFPKCL